MNLRHTSKRSIKLSLLAAALLVTALQACRPTAAPAPAPTLDYAAATVAVLATENAYLKAQVAGLATVEAHQATQIAAQGTMISYLATRPAPVVIPNPTLTPYLPVRGSVQIEGGRCCIGGIAGETTQVNVAFEATSPIAEVKDMRTRAGSLRFTERELAETEWEPYVPLKTYPVSVALNWAGFYVSVQYRDEQGNLSPVYHDDIAVEGHLPSPQTIP